MWHSADSIFGYSLPSYLIVTISSVNLQPTCWYNADNKTFDNCDTDGLRSY